ncbi:hypothetical protein [Pimelobacter simplex]|uniref:hypothetical protein n=1 Tax=Nocardioides simplex TaxID=2045 RepID=UPI003AB0F940
MRFRIDGWDPSYGSAQEETGELTSRVESTARIDASVEVSAESWTPIPSPTGASEPSSVTFVDGVRRIEARVWLPDADETTARLGVAASYAAGAVCCCDRGAHVLLAAERRGMFTTDADATDLSTRIGDFRTHHVAEDVAESPAVTLSAALQRELSALELVAAARARDEASIHGTSPDDDLLVIDGPLRSRDHLPRTVGFIKTHRAIYLPPHLNEVVARLSAGERTPVFLMGTTWDRYAWYLRLPCRPAAPWAGVVRVECAATLPVTEATQLAALSQAALPRYASVEYKDQRAPQNLVPIAGLERQLRRRLGDQKVVYRALQIAAAAS